MELVWSNNLPNTNNITTGPTAYQGDFSNSIALIWHNSAVGTVKLMDLAVESEYDIRRQGTLQLRSFWYINGGRCGGPRLPTP
jgi:hypothetical protein